MTVRIEADLLIPGLGDPLERATLILDEDGISFAGPRSEAPASPSASVYEVPVVMPGIWDCHTHLIGITSPDLEKAASLPAAAAGARVSADLGRMLDAGVTSIREVGGYGADLAPVVAEGSIRGPRIYGAGAVLSTTGGHADIHGLPLDFVESLPGRDRILGRTCDGVPECLRAVREQLRRNARVIKVCASGGVLSEVDDPIHQQFSEEELGAIVAEATRAGRVVAAHCHGKPGIMAALEAGATTIEHGSYLDEEAAEMMKSKNAILVPTRFVIEFLLSMLAGLPSYVARKAQAIAERHAEALRLAVATGVRVAMGTDLVMSGPVHGPRYAEVTGEIRNLIAAGMTPLGAIEAATATGPLTLGPQAPRSGRLEAGFDADVIALDANPLDDSSLWGNPDRVTHVWKAGSLVKG